MKLWFKLTTHTYTHMHIFFFQQICITVCLYAKTHNYNHTCVLLSWIFKFHLNLGKHVHVWSSLLVKNIFPRYITVMRCTNKEKLDNTRRTIKYVSTHIRPTASKYKWPNFALSPHDDSFAIDLLTSCLQAQVGQHTCLLMVKIGRRP